MYTDRRKLWYRVVRRVQCTSYCNPTTEAGDY